jgi:hypothetical protein
MLFESCVMSRGTCFRRLIKTRKNYYKIQIGCMETQHVSRYSLYVQFLSYGSFERSSLPHSMCDPRQSLHLLGSRQVDHYAQSKIAGLKIPDNLGSHYPRRLYVDWIVSLPFLFPLFASCALVGLRITTAVNKSEVKT